MTPATALEFVNLFSVGILAGILFIIEYGVGRATAAVLDEQLQLQLRQALIRGLRVLVPAILVPTVLLGVATTILDGNGPGFVFRCAGMLAVITCLLLAFFGTAPINQAILSWQPGAPPNNWRTLLSRWKRLDIGRTWAGIAAFALFLTAAALELTAH